MSSEDADEVGYIHEPETVDDRREDHGRVHPQDADREFDWRGWVLVGVIVLALVVAPGLILLRPPALPFEVAFLVLPLIPAFLLGATAVWATTRP